MPISTGNRSTFYTTALSTSVSWSHDNNGTFLAVAVAGASSDSGDGFTTANYGGVSLTLSTQRSRGSAPQFNHSAIYYTTAPPSGANTVNVSGGVPALRFRHGVAISLSSVDLSNPTVGTTGADSSEVTIPSTVDAFNINSVSGPLAGATPAAGAGDILLNASTGVTPSFANHSAASYQLSGSSVTVTMGWTNTTESVTVGASFRPTIGEVEESYQVVWID